MVFCALCEQPATAVQILPGGRARPVCILHDVPFDPLRKSDKHPPVESDKRDKPSALAAE